MRKDDWAKGTIASTADDKKGHWDGRQASLEMYLNEIGKEHEEIPSRKSILDAVQSRVNTGK